MKVLVIGISDKQDLEPFDVSTNTGKLVNKIECKCGFNFYKINLVQFAPLDRNNKLRYPNEDEIKLGCSNLQSYIDDLKPDRIILFGRLVQKSFVKYIKTESKVINELHPSYILVYRRKCINDYIDKIVKDILL